MPLPEMLEDAIHRLLLPTGVEVTIEDLEDSMGHDQWDDASL